MTLIPFNQNVQYDLVIGLADIHIKNHSNERQRSRYDDYQRTFKQLATQLRQLTKNKHPVVVICGDVFDIKDRLTTYSVRLFNQLIKILSTICPLIIFKGNHDYVSVDGKESDLIGCLVDQYQSNVYYLPHTGTYLLGNIGFSYIDILDLIKTGSTCEKIDQLPPFPDQYGTDTKVKIGLFHGTVNGSSLANHRSSSTGYPLKWVEGAGHDYVIMGDNHTQQILGNRNHMCYCSSLIQQNFGEPFIDGHGFVVLDLDKKELIPYNVKCPSGQVYLSYRDNQWINSQSRQPVTDMISHTDCPPKWIISIRGQTTPEQIEELTNQLRLNSIEYQLVKDLVNICEDQSSTLSDLDLTRTDELTDLSRYNCPTYWKEFIHERNPELVLDFIDHPQSLLVDNLTNDFIKKCNQDLQQLIKDHEKQMVCTVAKKRLIFRLLDAKWAWLLPYGKDNAFNFEKCRGKLTCISGQNSTGKSALTEILMIGLFGLSNYHTGIPSRHLGSQDSSVILNRYKPVTENAYVVVDFLLDGQQYQVSRKFNRVKDKMTTCDCCVMSNGNTLYSGTTGVKDFIEKNIGDPQTFLMSVLVSQNNDYDLFKMDKKEQIILFDQLLNLQSYNSFVTFVKSVGDKYKRCLQQTETTYACLVNHHVPFDVSMIGQTETDLSNLQEDLTSLRSELSHIAIPNDLKTEDLEQDLSKEETSEQSYLEYDPEQLSNERVIYQDKMKELGRKSNKRIDNPRYQLAQINRVNEPSLSVASCNNKLSYLSDIMVDREQLSQYQKQLDTLTLNVPNRPEVTDQQIRQFQQDYQEFLDEVKALKNPLISNQFNPTELIQFCQEHPMISSNYTVSQLSKLIQKDLKKLTCIEWYDQAQKIFDETLKDITVEYQALFEQIQLIDQKNETNQQQHQQLTGQIQSIDCQIAKIRRQITTTSVQRAKWLENQSQYTDENYQQQVRQLSLIEQTIEQQKQLSLLVQQQENLMSQITVLNEAHKVHNPDCWACRQRKWVTNLEQIKSQLGSVNDQISDINNSLDKTNLTGELSVQILEIQQWIKQYHKSEQMNQQMKLDEQLCELENQKQEILNQSQVVKKELDILRKSKMNLTRQLSELEPRYKSVVFANDQRDKWRQWDVELIRVTDNQKIETYHQLMKTYQDLNVPYYLLQSELTGKYNQYQTHKTSVESQIAKCYLLDKLEQWALYDQYQQYLADVYASLLGEIESHLSAHYWAQVMKYQPLYHQSECLKKQIDVKTQQFYRLESQLVSYREQLEASNKTQVEMANMGQLIIWLKHQMVNIGEVHTIMLSFRQYLYQSVILPIITSKVNEMVGLVTNQSDFRLTGQMGDGGIQWFINGDLPARSGGFAMNLNSLCIKIILSRFLNYSPIISDCLILDECFVQSDSDKISEISQFLTGMLSIYSTVIIISHIQSIVDVCETSVMIEKKNGISYVKWDKTILNQSKKLPLKLKIIK